jgi:hypothetical protein
MKTFVMCLAIISSSIAFAGTFVENGECGPGKISFRVLGSSALSIEEAISDSRKVAKSECKLACHNLPGSNTSFCGPHEAEFNHGVHLVAVDYLCICPF